MNLTETVIEGTLKPDGTLELDEKPNLPPGRVKVVLQAVQRKPSQVLGQGYFRVMQEIRTDQRARGHVPRSTDEVNADRQAMRQELDDEIEAAIHLQEECLHLSTLFFHLQLLAMQFQERVYQRANRVWQWLMLAFHPLHTHR